MTGESGELGKEPRMKYLFLRHAETEVSDRREWHGKADPSLSPNGRMHALSAAEKLDSLGHKVNFIVASDYCRAVETAKVIGEVLNCSVRLDPLLRERYLGDWEGLTQSEIEQRWPGFIDAWRAGKICGPPGGETDAEVAKRIAHVLTESVWCGSKLQLVISHAGLLRGLLSFHGMPNEEIPPLGGRWLNVMPSNRQIHIGEGASL